VTDDNVLQFPDVPPDDDIPPIDEQIVAGTAQLGAAMAELAASVDRVDLALAKARATIPDAELATPENAVKVYHSAQVLLEKMLAVPVPTTDQEYAELADYLGASKFVQDALEAEWRPSIKQAHTLWKGLCEKLAEHARPLREQGDKHIHRIGGIYVENRLRAQRAEQEAQRQAERQTLTASAEIEAAALEAQGLPEEAEQTREYALTAPLTDAGPVEVPRAAGLRVTVRYVVTIVNPELVPREFCVPSQALLDAFAKANKGLVPIAGCTIDKKTSTERAGSRAR
jgi:hypothetical protein